MKRESLAVWLIISSFSIPLLIIPSLKAQSQWLSTNSNGSTSVAPVVITFNTGTTKALFHDLPPDDGYTSEHAEISDEWYGNGLAWVPAVDATRDFIAQVDPDVVVFQEIFHSEECADIPPEAREDFVCEDWMPGDPTVTQTVLGEDFQIACHLDKPDKCAGVHRRFGRFRGCDSNLCLDGLDGTEIPGCGSGARVGSGVIDLVTGGSITLVNIHGTSGINQDDTDCRVQQFEQVFVDLGDGEPAANGAVNLVMGDLNVDPGRLDGREASATRFNDFVGDDNPFQYISYFGPDAPRTYLGLWTIDYVVSDTFDGSCQVPGVTPGVPDVIDAVYFDHKPVVCELEGGSVGAVSPLFTTDLDHNWKSIPIARASATPVVIAGPPTLHGGQPGVVRVRNVDGSHFEARFQEWLYLDEIHLQEDIPFLVLERGRQTMPDGSIWEAGTLSLGGTGVWQRHPFGQAFPGTPFVFLAVQSFNGRQTVTARVRNVDANGFDAALYEEEGLMDGHKVEEVGYLAVVSPPGSGTVSIGGTHTPYVLQRVGVDHRLMPVLSSVLKLEEERSADSEVAHVEESVAVLGLGDKVFAQVVTHNGNDTVALRQVAPEQNALVEWGAVEGVTHEWTKVPLAKRYTNPVVVARPVSNRGGQPGVIRLRNVKGDSFELQYQEWAYLNGVHTREQVFYLVAEAGTQNLAGLRVEAGTLDSATLLPGSEAVSFSTQFAARPALFTSVQTFAGADPVTTRIVSASASGFELAMQEEEAKNDGHTSERLGWMAVAFGDVRTADGRRVLVLEDATNHIPTLVPYGETLNRRFPVMVSDIASTLGGDPGFLRYQNPGPSTIELFIDEEQSLDLETAHTFEDISVFVAE